MKRHAAKVKDLEVRRRAEDKEIAREFAELEAQLKALEGRAYKAEDRRQGRPPHLESRLRAPPFSPTRVSASGARSGTPTPFRPWTDRGK